MYSSYSVSAAVCSVVFPVLAATAVGFRLHARRIKGVRLGVDDYTVLAALAATIALCVLILYGSVAASIGQDLTTITPPQYESYQRLLYFIVIVAFLSYGLVKVSVLLLYKRIFDIQQFRLRANVLLGIVVAWTLAAIFTQIFSAWPIAQWWTFGGHYNMNYGAFLLAFAAMDMVLDLIILSLPLPLIKNLHISTRRKVLLIGVLWLGVFCVVAVAVRLYFTYQLSLAGNSTDTSNDWFSYVSVNNVIWAEIESCCSIIASCLPCLGPLVNKIRIPETWSHFYHSRLLSYRKSASHNNKHLDTDDSDDSLHLPRHKPIVALVPGGAEPTQHERWYNGHEAEKLPSARPDPELGLPANGAAIRVDRSFAVERPRADGAPF